MSSRTLTGERAFDDAAAEAPDAAWLGRLAEACGLVVVAVAAVGAAGWTAGAAWVVAPGPNAVPIMPPSIAALLAAGVALMAIGRGPARGPLRALAGGGAAVVGAIALLTLASYLAGRDLGLDRWCVGWIRDLPAIVTGSRPAFSTGVALAGVAAGLAAALRAPAASWVRVVGAGLALATGYFFGLAHAFGVPEMLAFLGPKPAALPTVVAMLALGLGLLVAVPAPDPGALLASPGPGGATARRLLPFVVFGPFLLGVARLAGEQAGVLPREAGGALAGYAFALGTAAITLWGAGTLEGAWRAERRLTAEALVAQRRESEHLDQMRAEEVRRHEVARLREIQQMKDHLLSTLSHELKTPLALITGYAELLEDKYGGDAHLVGLQDGVRRLDQHLQRLLDLAALVGGTMPLYRGPVDASEVFAVVAHQLGEPTVAEGGRLEVAIADGLPPLDGDGRRLVQLVAELVDNALKYAGPGTPVRLAAAAGPDGAVELAVCDAGPGLPPAVAAALWEPFGQAETGDARRSSGLGIGLTLARLLAERHGGRVMLAPPGAAGCCFRVILPASRGAGMRLEARV